jgi:uncharacterized protein GlcG (DUF336 family)
MPRKKKVDVPILTVRKGATLKEVYAAAKKAFTAADLQHYFEIEPMIPAEQVLAELNERLEKLVEKHNPGNKDKRRSKTVIAPKRRKLPVRERHRPVTMVTAGTGRSGSHRMPQKKNHDVPILKVRKGATLKEVYAAAKKAFTAADLQKFAEIEPMYPAEQVLAEMDQVHEQVVARKAKRK